MNKSPLRFFGGKTRIAEWLVSHFPKDMKFYGEVFAGGLSPLFARDPHGSIEVANDVWWELTNFWRVLQSDTLFQEFKRLCETTPFSQVEFEAAKLPVEMEFFGDSVVSAWHFFIRNRMSFSGSGTSFPPTAKRTRRGINENVASWLSVVDKLEDFHRRLRFVEIRRMDFRLFLKQFDASDATFYADPPYLKSTRTAGKYAHDLTEQDHLDLLAILEKLKGRFILSGYPSEMYDEWAARNGFQAISIEVPKDMSTAKEKPRGIETIWRNFT